MAEERIVRRLAAILGICISRQAFEQVDGKLALAFRQLGPQTLKNIAKPMDVFAVEASDLASGQAYSSISSNLKQEIQYDRLNLKKHWQPAVRASPLADRRLCRIKFLRLLHTGYFQPPRARLNSRSLQGKERIFSLTMFGSKRNTCTAHKCFMPHRDVKFE